MPDVEPDLVEVRDTEDALAIHGIELQFGDQSFAPAKNDAERNPFRRNPASLREDDCGSSW
jgi:hypothetical protein